MTLIKYKYIAVFIAMSVLDCGCGSQNTENQEKVAGETQKTEDVQATIEEGTASGEKKEMFGEDCIAEQCFEVELNGCEGEDETPELVSGREGYFVNLYTYQDGRMPVEDVRKALKSY